jgi:hypothetical protein
MKKKRQAKRMLKCGAHGTEEWRGDIVCTNCGAIWIREDSIDEPGKHNFRLLNTVHEYLSGDLGECKCGADLFAKGDEGTGVPICSHCVDANEIYKPPVLH